MKCTIALNINKGSMAKSVENYGAASIIKLNVPTIRYSDLVTGAKAPDIKTLKNNDNMLMKGASYLFSNSKPTTVEGLKSLGIDEVSLKKLDAAGGLGFSGISEKFFADKGIIASPTQRNKTNFIVEAANPEEYVNDIDRSYIRITKADIAKARGVVDDIFDPIKGEEEFTGDTVKRDDQFREGMEFLLTSALYRGFDVVIDGTLSADVVNNAIKKYNKLKDAGTSVKFVSQFRGDENIIKSSYPLADINSADIEVKPLELKVNNDNLFLNAFVSENDRRTFNTFKKASNRSKLHIAHRIANIFKKMVPNLDTEILTNAEIVTKYGWDFAGKAGFTIENKIIVNAEHFSPDTMFHEFGHFYMKWLDKSNPEAKAHILQIIAEEHADSIDGMTTLYNSTGLEFNESDILEEIFVDELGMKAAESLSSVIEGVDSANINDSVDAFAEEFVRKLTKNRKLTLEDANFGITSNLLDMYNTAITHANSVNSSSLFDDMNGDSIDSIRDFFIQEKNATEVFNGLAARGLIRKAPNGKLLLFDTNGNRYNAKGDIDPSYSIKLRAWDTRENIKFNENRLKEISGYLDKFKNHATAMFSMKLSQAEVKEVITNATKGVGLNAAEDAYVQDGIEMRRTTQFLQDTFGAMTEAENFIYGKMWSDAKEQARAKTKLTDLVEIEEEATQAAEKFFKGKGPEFEKTYNDIATIFEFKMLEGTYLHNLAEFYFRALNYSSEIDYQGIAKEDRNIMYFSKHIIKGLTDTDIEFEKYIHDFFTSHLKGQEHKKEYKEFMAGFEFLKKARAESSRFDSLKFLELLRAKVVPEINKLKGPITIMPEVQLASKSLGVAGKLDLLVLDGDGRAHIYDYKTKETGKEKYWDYASGVRMKGTMSAFPENAKMKASIQTSVYKLILKEMGIETGQSKVFYVESDINKFDDPNEIFEYIENPSADKVRQSGMNYSPVDIKSKVLLDVSAELLDHFNNEEGRQSEIFKGVNSGAADILEVVYKASGDTDIENLEHAERLAEAIYDKAIKRQAGNDGERFAAAYASLGLGSIGGKGLSVILPGGVFSTLDPKVKGRAESIAAILEMIKGRKAVRSMGAELNSLFYSLNRTPGEQKIASGGKDVDKAMRWLLSGADSNSHELINMSSDASLGLAFSDTWMLKNKITGEHRMLILNHDDKRNLPFEKDRRNIFGKYMTNNNMRALLPNLEWKNNNHSMRLIKTGLLMIQQKQANPDFKVSLVVANSPIRDASKALPDIQDIGTILLATRTMLDQMIKAGEKLPDSMLEMFENQALFDTQAYLKNPIESLSEYLHMASGNLERTTDIFTSKKGKERRERLKEITENFEPNQDNEHLIKALHNFRISLQNGPLPTEVDRLNSDLWTLTDQVLQFLHGFNYSLNPKNTTFVNNFLTTTSKAANPYQAAFNRQIQKVAVDAREDFIDYKTEHNALLEKLAASKGETLSGVSPALYRASMKRIFKNLYKNDNTNRATAFQLKDPSQLTGVEREYVEYVKKTLQKYTDLASFSKKNIPNGWLPLVPKSRQSYKNDTNPYSRAQESLKGMRLNKAFKDPDNSTVDDEFTIESKFKGQLPGKDASAAENYTDARRFILAVDETGETIEDQAVDRPLNKIEDNIENILDSYVLGSIDAYYYRDVTAFGRSLLYSVKRHEAMSGKPYHDLTTTLELIQKRVIHHKESEGNSAALKSLNKFATTAAIAGTVSQALLETFTNPLVTSANYVADKLYGTLFGGIREFSAKSYGKAFAMVMNPASKQQELITALDMLYGITTSDSKAIKEMMNKLEKNSLFQTKNLMFVNKIMMDTWQKVTLVAYMIEQGSFYAHSLDNTGNIVYDEKKDKRFFDKSASAEEQLEKSKLYDTVKAELSKHANGLSGSYKDDINTRKLNRAWTGFDSNYVKEMITEVYSSLDDSSKSLSTYYTWMGFMSKMRNWIYPKVARYFQKPMTADENFSAARPTKIIDPSAPDGYRIEFRGQPTEGILYTVQSVYRQLAEHKTQVIKEGTLNEDQKKNLSKLLADVLVFATVSGAAYGIFKGLGDDDKPKSEMETLLYDRLVMATGDVFFLKSIMDMTTGNSSMFIGVSIAGRFVDNAINAAVITPQALWDDDITAEDVLAAQNKLAGSSYGLYRTGETFYDMVIE